MRGKVNQQRVDKQSVRITPAYAGKSQNSLEIFLIMLGSPPPMRGKVTAEINSASDIRITPAYAGKS